MVSVSNMFREFSMIYVDGYNALSNEEKDLFDKVYHKHLSSMKIKKRLEYQEHNIKRIDPLNKSLVVHFNNEECFIYTASMRYMKVP